jgi:uncharacterized protein (UPF0261 family)
MSSVYVVGTFDSKGDELQEKLTVMSRPPPAGPSR